MRLRFLASALMVALAGLAVLSAGCGSSDGVTLQGAGATFPAPVYKRWFLEYYKLHPDVRVNYQAIGSGAGISRFTEGLLTFGASDAFMSKDEIAKVPESKGVILLPMTAGSIVLCYNVPGAPPDLRLTRRAYVDIFRGRITSWADPAILAANPGLSLPDTGITVVRRMEDSGTTFAFTNHLCAVSEDWKKEKGGKATKSIPDPPKNSIAGKGNSGVAAFIKQTPGAIGYLERDIVPAQYQDQLGRAKIIITNYHAFQPREKSEGSRLTKQLSGQTATGVNVETPDQMVRRVCRELNTKKHIVVLNDEAHHCYRRKPDGEDEKLTGDDRVEARQRDEEARVWITGLEAVKAKIGVKAIYDLSATPFFLRGSGYPEGTLFPWVVSDFSLIDAIEAGIVKVPRVPVADDSMTGEQPTYRDLWLRIREHLPKKGRKTEAVSAEPKLPVELQGALLSLYGNYEKYYRLWEKNAEARARGITPPVFIVVCNNTNVSKLVFDFIAGWEKPIGEQTVVQAGQLPIFRNDDGNGAWLHRPNTILVDSRQLESGEAMSDDFKKIAAREIDEFKADYRARFPGRDTDNLADEDLLREVMNTVGKAGKLGENVRCVVSVSMLTEGWDANTVTHVLGVRAFGTQLLCEQVVGRALRRMSYAVNQSGRFDPEYAEVYGVPFSFIPCSGATKEPKPGPLPTRVRALESRIACEITFPRLLGYRYDVGDDRLTAAVSAESGLALSTADIPTKTENAPIVGESSIHTLDDLKRRRPNEVAFLLAKLTLEKYFRDDAGNDKPWLFPQLLDIAKRWLAECVTLKDNTFPQLLLLIEFAHDAADRIYQAIVASTDGTAALKPILRPYDTVGSTRYVDFDTTRAVFATRADRCHISHVVADTGSWEQKMAEALEDMPEVVRYVKNHNLNFTIPYTLNGEERQYVPDFLACIDDGGGADDLLNLIVEVTGEKKKDKAAKVATARTLWVPAINNHGGFGRWAFLEVADPWDAKSVIRQWLAKREPALV